jgi:hypothetical protein
MITYKFTEITSTFNHRYLDPYTIQLGILPGPNNPNALVDTFLKPIVDEFQKLSTAGMTVYKDGVLLCKAKVHLVIATGDLPASAELSHHKTSAAKYGCRICTIKTEKIGKRTCFLDPYADIRLPIQFTNPDPVNVSNNVKNKLVPIDCELTLDYLILMVTPIYRTLALDLDLSLRLCLLSLHLVILDWMNCI